MDAVTILQPAPHERNTAVASPSRHYRPNGDGCRDDSATCAARKKHSSSRFAV